MVLVLVREGEGDFWECVEDCCCDDECRCSSSSSLSLSQSIPIPWLKGGLSSGGKTIVDIDDDDIPPVYTDGVDDFLDDEP